MFLLIDKPKGITSHDVIYRLRKITGIKKIGHAGTLDPNATGLLIVGIGRESTKKISEIVGKNKEYSAEIFLGEERDTDDLEGRTISKKENGKKPFGKKVEDTLLSFVGKISQVPPAYSAKRVKGKKAYQLARKGVEFDLKPQNVEIFKVEIVSYDYPILKIEIGCSKGTYIRSLARDVGRKLGCGAYLKELRRTKIGDFNLKDAVLLNKLNQDNWKTYCLE